MATQESIRDLGNQMAKWDREKRQAEINASLGAELNPDYKTPFQDQNQFLAEQVRQLGEQSEERARLRSEEAREQYDEQVRQNVLKEKSRAETAQQQTELSTAQSHERNLQEAKALIDQLQSVSFPIGQNQYTMPKETLRELSVLGQQWDKLRERAPELGLSPFDYGFMETGYPTIPQQQAIAPVNQEHPATFQNGRYSDYTTNEDGSVQLRLSSGEVYKGGNVEELLEKISKSKVDTTRWTKEQLAIAKQSPAQPVEPQPPTNYGSIADLGRRSRQRHSPDNSDSRVRPS